MIKLNAYAKVNLTLEILNSRSDGYHEIATVMQTIDLSDTLILEHASDIVLETDRSELNYPNNLVLQAANLIGKRTGRVLGARISLTKRIPVSAGLGGGSSDAAATLLGLNRLWGLGMTIDEIAPIAAEIGSDVPFFLYSGTAMVLGRGERVQPIPPVDIKWLVLLVPPIYIAQKTSTIYSLLSEADYTPGWLTRKLASRIRNGSDVPPQLLFNAFDDVAPQAFPGLDRYWSILHSLGVEEIHIAGTGPTLFAPVSRKETGTALQLMLERHYGWESYLVATWQPPKGNKA